VLAAAGGEYSIESTRSARRDLLQLQEGVASRILRRVEVQDRDPWPAACLKPVSAENLWRIRVYEYRVVHAVDGELVDIRIIHHRADAYR